MQNYFRQFPRDENYDNIVLHTLACILRIDIHIYDFSNPGGPIKSDPLIFNRMRFSSMLEDSHLSLLHNMEEKTISVIRYQAIDLMRYALLYEMPQHNPLAQEIYKQWSTGAISHVFKSMLPFKENSKSTYKGTNIPEPQIGLHDSGSVAGSDFMEEAVQSQIYITLQCGHQLTKLQLRTYLQQEFIQNGNEQDPHVFFKISHTGKSRPACRVCQTYMTYKDFQTIYDQSLQNEQYFAFIENDWNMKEIEVKTVLWPEMRNSNSKISHISNPTSVLHGMNEPLVKINEQVEEDKESVKPAPPKKCTRREKFMTGGFFTLLVIVIALVVVILVFVV